MAMWNNSNMSMTVGNISEFKPKEDNWNIYIKQLEGVFEPIEIWINRREK